MRYKVLWRLSLDGHTYQEGDFVILESDKAKELMSQGVIKREEKPFSKERDHQLSLNLDK